MSARCDEIRELAPELALGIVEGEERGRALEHLADCPDCRRRVEELTEVADELLLLAPHKEPLVGFEERALAPLRPPAPQRRRRRRLRLVLAPVAAAAAAVGVTLAVVAGDLRDASHYHQALDTAHGKEFESYSLRTGDGAAAGTVFSYEGSPSWVFLTVDAAHRGGVASGELVLDDGSQVPLRPFAVDPSTGSWGGAIPVDPKRVSVLRLTGPGGQPLIAKFNS